MTALYLGFTFYILRSQIRISKLWYIFQSLNMCRCALVLNVPPIAKVIWRRGLSFKSHMTDLRSRESSPWFTRQVYYSLHHSGSSVTEDTFLSLQTVKNLISNPSIFTYVVGAQKNRLIETVLLNTHNRCFGWEIRKLIFWYTLFTKGLHLSYHTALEGFA